MLNPSTIQFISGAGIGWSGPMTFMGHLTILSSVWNASSYICTRLTTWKQTLSLKLKALRLPKLYLIRDVYLETTDPCP